MGSRALRTLLRLLLALTAGLLLLVALELQIAPLAASGTIGDVAHLVLAPFFAHFVGGLIGGRAYLPVALLASAAIELMNVRFFARWNGIDPWSIASQEWTQSLFGVLAAVAGAYLGARNLRSLCPPSRPTLS